MYQCYFSANPANGIFSKSPWTTLSPSICKRIPNEIDNKHAGRQTDGRTNIPINRSKEQTHKAAQPPRHTPPNQQKQSNSWNGFVLATNSIKSNGRTGRAAKEKESHKRFLVYNKSSICQTRRPKRSQKRAAPSSQPVPLVSNHDETRFSFVRCPVFRSAEFLRLRVLLLQMSMLGFQQHVFAFMLRLQLGIQQSYGTLAV